MSTATPTPATGTARTVWNVPCAYCGQKVGENPWRGFRRDGSSVFLCRNARECLRRKRA